MVSKKRQLPKQVPGNATDRAVKAVYLNRDADFLEGWQRPGNDALVLISIKLLQDSFQCFSDWDKQEMQAFWAFNRKIHAQTWEQLYQSSSKGNKTGLALTYVDASQYPDSAFRKAIAPDTRFFELRVNQKIRVHGFRDRSLFYLCWLDRNHTICK